MIKISRKLLLVMLCSVGFAGQFLLMNGLTNKVQAESAPTNITRNKNNNSTSKQAFRPAGDADVGHTTGAAVRHGTHGLCAGDTTAPANSITALVSSADSAVTLKERPTLLAYIPETSAKTGSLTIKGEGGDYFYETSFSVPQNGGIISVSLPADAPGLKVNEDYTWFMSVTCGAEAEPDDPFVSAKIARRDDPALLTKIQKANPTEQAALYQQELIWYDALASLGELRKAQPQDGEVRANWNNLLQSVALEAMATEKLN